jgi:hypothetical protein
MLCCRCSAMSELGATTPTCVRQLRTGTLASQTAYRFRSAETRAKQLRDARGRTTTTAAALRCSQYAIAAHFPASSQLRNKGWRRKSLFSFDCLVRPVRSLRNTDICANVKPRAPPRRSLIPETAHRARRISTTWAARSTPASARMPFCADTTPTGDNSAVRTTSPRARRVLGRNYRPGMAQAR